MRRMLALGVLWTLLFAACGGVEQGSSGGGGGQGGGDKAIQAAIEAASSDFGEILVDPEGMTLYMFIPDQKKDGKPTCYGECADAWPAYEAPDELTAGDGLDQSLLGSVKREDGSAQVTYGNLPLYNFSGDEAAGDVNGQGLSDVWWVMSSDGKPVQEK